MSELEKLYHWTNLILTPIILLLSFSWQLGAEILGPILIGWTTVSALLSPQLRSWVIGAFASIMGGSALVSCMGSITAIGVFLFVAVVAATLGFFLLLPALWLLSLKAVIDDQRGLI